MGAATWRLGNEAMRTVFNWGTLIKGPLAYVTERMEKIRGRRIDPSRVVIYRSGTLMNGSKLRAEPI